MGLSKNITLTIKDYEIRLDKQIKFYENDTIDLCFSILEYGIEVKDGVSINKLMPIQALTAYMLIETPQGVDYAESTKIENNKIVFNLGVKYSQFVGIGHMQIVIKDSDGCRVTLPEFEFEIKKSINTDWDREFYFLSTEDDSIITDEFGRKIHMTKISDMPESENLSEESYTMIIDEEGNKRLKVRAIVDAVEDSLDTKFNAYTDEINGDVERIKGEVNEISESLDNLEGEVNELKEGNINIDLTDYVTKNELSTKADKTELHSHTNKSVLDSISSAKVTEWNNKSTFSGDYNDLTNKPTIPTLNGYATEQYVDEEIKKIDVTEQLTDYAKKSELHSHSNKSVLDGITTSKVTEWNNKSTFDGNYNSLTNKPIIPTKTSQLNNDNGFITSIPSEYVTETELSSKGYLTQHQSLEGLATEEYVKNKIAEAQLEGEDIDLSGYAVKGDLEKKVDKVEGKSLISDSEIVRLATVKNYDDTEIRNALNNKANASELHSHTNKSVLDNITSSKVNEWNNKSTFDGNYNNLTNKPTIPTNVSDLTNDSGYLTTHQDISGKVDKIDGKGLSTNDYTTAEKNKLSGLTNYTHPSTHSATMITEDSTHRFVSDSEKTSWNNKSNLALGTTSTTAYRGDYGNTAYNHSQTAHAPSNAQKNSDITKAEIEAKLIGDITTHTHSNYATKEELEEIENILNETNVVYVTDISECTDITKTYIIDGYIYKYKQETVVVPPQPKFTNLLPSAVTSSNTPYVGDNGEKGYRVGWRINSNGIEVEETSECCTGFIPCLSSQTVRIKNATKDRRGYDTVYFFTSSFSKTSGTIYFNDLTSTDGVYTFNSPELNNTAYIRITFGKITSDTIVTVNEPIEYTSETTKIEEGFYNTGVLYSGGNEAIDILSAEVKEVKSDVQTNTNDISNIKKAMSSQGGSLTMYISPNGTDANDGLSKNTPKKTLKACLNLGATRVSAERGTYTENFQFWDYDSLELFPTDNDEKYSIENHKRKYIVFDTSETLNMDNFTTSGTIKSVTYAQPTTSHPIYKVFVGKTSNPLYSDTDYGTRYNATIYLLSDDEKTVHKLKPVLTLAECQSTTTTFFYDGAELYMNADWTNVTQVRVVSTQDTTFYFNNFKTLKLTDVESRFSGAYAIDLRNCANVELYNCRAMYTMYASGFHPVNTNGTFKACYATKCYDGYGISGYGHTTYIDCVSEFNFDDGMSHHNGSKGTIIGGRYEGNGKGGNTPAYGCEVNIYGGLFKDNASFGIGYLYTSTAKPASGMVQGAVMVGNPIGLSVDKNCDVIAMNCLYIDNNVDKKLNGNVTEYNITIPQATPSEPSEEIINQLTKAVGTDGQPFRGDNGEIGYKSDWRISMSSGEKAQDGCSTTGYIPVKIGQTMRLYNVAKGTEGYQYLVYYDASFAKVGNYQHPDLELAYGTTPLVYTFSDIPATTKYFRVVCGDMTADTIITLDQEWVF